ncbi:cyclophane-forming radical SAM/SPASM peptide maturase GrrM/OscB [Nonomuraea sp. NPDC049637]|uniref:cyclophane-forming radical SAM/SPASM peptide maturase GrrM/OscB n=1 Tax=Nonomuraea sp. NPDC049637 TaxID=3154356 RepID=UPI0034164BEE
MHSLRAVIRQVILQPTSLCNLNCSYCYVPQRRDGFMMSRATLEASIKKVLHSPLTHPDVQFIWHAGEPLTAGVEHFEEAMRLISLHNIHGLNVEKSVQTNGTLVDERWCDLFAEHDMSVGISVDGPQFLHDSHRVNWSGKGSHRAVMRGYRKLKERGIRLGALCVLTRTSLRHPDEIFDFFVDNGFQSVGFNVEEVENGNTVSSLSGGKGEADTIAAEYRAFVDRIFDRWRESPAAIEIREISDYLAIIKSKISDPSYRHMSYETEPLAIITIQKNGDMSTSSPELAGGKSEEFDDFVIANINAPGSLDSLLPGPALDRISKEISHGVAACADECLYFDICGGAYTSNKYFENGSLRSTETTSCRLHRQILGEVIIDKLKGSGS